MPQRFDAANKHLVEAYPGDWIALAGLPGGSNLRIIEADLSAVSTAADKLILVGAAEPYVGHIEFQAGPDDELDERVLVYDVLARRHLKLPVRSVVFLLRPQALTKKVTGRVSDASPPDHELKFSYKLVKVWELPVESLLKGGLGTLALAPISAVDPSELPDVIEGIKDRLDRELPPEEAREFWTATRILMGLKYSREIVRQLLRGVQNMEESTTYQEIIELGVERGIQRGMKKGIEAGIEQGRVVEARAVLLRQGTKRLGPPKPQVKARLDSITDIQRLEELMDRVLDGSVKTWNALLK